MTTQTAIAPSQACSPGQRVTRSLLGYGVLAGTVFGASVLIQGLTRHGFRLAHHDASLLSNGPLGWIQIATFVACGAMTIAAAAGMRRALAGRAGRLAGSWGPRLIAVYGAGLIAAGLLRADPAYGFGPGAAAVAWPFTPAPAGWPSWPRSRVSPPGPARAPSCCRSTPAC